MLKGTALTQADGDETAGDLVASHDSVQNVLVNEKPNTMLAFILFSTEKTLCHSSVVVSPKFFSLILRSPGWSICTFPFRVLVPGFPTAVSVVVFQVPMVMLSLPRIFDDAPVGYLTPSSWCTAEGAVLVDPGGDRSGMVWSLVVIAW